MIRSIGQVGLVSLAKRLVKLAPRLVLSSFPIHRARHLLNRARQRLHLVDEALTLKSRASRPRELVELVAHTGQGRLGGKVDGLRWKGSGHGRKPRSRWRGKFGGHRRERETRVALRSPKAGLRDECGMIDASAKRRGGASSAVLAAAGLLWPARVSAPAARTGTGRMGRLGLTARRSEGARGRGAAIAKGGLSLFG